MFAARINIDFDRIHSKHKRAHFNNACMYMKWNAEDETRKMSRFFCHRQIAFEGRKKEVRQNEMMMGMMIG